MKSVFNVKDFILHSEALELKQLGFDEPCFGVYATKDGYVRKSAYDEIGDAPTYSQAFRWFRDKYDLYCYVEPYKDNQFDYVVVSDLFGQEDCDGELLNTYEEAELACLREMIKIVKEKQK